MQPEARLVTKIIAELNKLDQCYAQKNHGTPFGKPTVDVTGCISGRMFQIEVKMPGGKPTARQLQTLKTWEAAGAIVGCATSVDEALKIVLEGV